MFRVAMCLGFAVALSGCGVSGRDEITTGSLDRIVQPTSVSEQDGPNKTGQGPRAIASLPSDAGAIKRVTETMSTTGLRQEVIFDAPVPGLPESAIDLRLLTSATSARDASIAAARPSEAGIRAELAAQFPRMAMQIVETPRANAYGPYGLAVGRWDNGVRCLYAWQWIDAIGAGQPASVRIRLCRSGLTLDQMAGLVDRLRIDPARLADPIVAARATLPEAPRRVQRPAPRKPDSRPAVVAAMPVVTAARPETPLDPSLPAAAYRGPMTAAK